jgi:hypothetical protein
MSKKPSSEDVPMTDLNVEIPEELMDRIQLAKALTKTPIRHIVMDAVEAWLKSQGVNAASEKARKLVVPPKPPK